MREIEYDGFITREEDLMKPKAKFADPCIYPRCEECTHYNGTYCGVPMVVTKQKYYLTEEKIENLSRCVAELENIVIEQILGEHNVRVEKERK